MRHFPSSFPFSSFDTGLDQIYLIGLLHDYHRFGYRLTRESARSSFRGSTQPAGTVVHRGGDGLPYALDFTGATTPGGCGVDQCGGDGRIASRKLDELDFGKYWREA
jgi:hypothetical protein